MFFLRIFTKMKTYARYCLQGTGQLALGRNFGRFEDAWNYAKQNLGSQWDMMHSSAKDCFIDFATSEIGVWYMRYARCNIETKENDYLVIVRHIFSEEDLFESDFEVYEKHWLEREQKLEEQAAYDAQLEIAMDLA